MLLFSLCKFRTQKTLNLITNRCEKAEERKVCKILLICLSSHAIPVKLSQRLSMIWLLLTPFDH